MQRVVAYIRIYYIYVCICVYIYMYVYIYIYVNHMYSTKPRFDFWLCENGRIASNLELLRDFPWGWAVFFVRSKLLGAARTMKHITVLKSWIITQPTWAPELSSLSPPVPVFFSCTLRHLGRNSPEFPKLMVQTFTIYQNMYPFPTSGGFPKRGYPQSSSVERTMGVSMK